MPDSQAAQPRGPRARLEDVARAAGVSKSTVSRVLSDDATLSVRAETRERVRALAQELGYRPHPVARALATPATGALALLVPALSNPAYVEIIRGAYRRARERGYVLLCAEDFEDQEADEAFTELVDGGRVDGLLIASARPENRLLAALERHRVPHVFVNRSVPGARANVTLDVERGRAASPTSTSPASATPRSATSPARATCSPRADARRRSWPPLESTGTGSRRWRTARSRHPAAPQRASNCWRSIRG